MELCWLTACEGRADNVSHTVLPCLYLFICYLHFSLLSPPSGLTRLLPQLSKPSLAQCDFDSKSFACSPFCHRHERSGPLSKEAAAHALCQVLRGAWQRGGREWDLWSLLPWGNNVCRQQQGCPVPWVCNDGSHLRQVTYRWTTGQLGRMVFNQESQTANPLNLTLLRSNFWWPSVS